MLEAVFISDLHLHPQDQAIEARFNRFLDWARTNTKSLFILGDFFHVWAGDDGFCKWSLAITKALEGLSNAGIKIYFMPGNRDFLLGKRFASLAKLTLLSDPACINIDNKRILLSHGDRYCTQDKAHQGFRLLTRNAFFKTLFLLLPFRFRTKIATTIRTNSQNSKNKPIETLQVVKKSVQKSLKKYKAEYLVHGHTHKPECIEYLVKTQLLTHYILSDWDDIPTVLCYDKSDGFYFKRIWGM